jgi:hypothetical protein
MMDSRHQGRFINPALGHASPGQLFVAFLPRMYLERAMLPAINRNHQKRNYRDLVPVIDIAEFMRWIALWLHMFCSIWRSRLFWDGNRLTRYIIVHILGSLGHEVRRSNASERTLSARR